MIPSNSCLIRPLNEPFKIVYESEERMFRDFLGTNKKSVNMNACTRLHWYYAYWHTVNLKKQQQRRHEMFSGIKKKTKQPQLIIDPKVMMELDYILYITTDTRTLSSELNLDRGLIEKTINIFLNTEIWNYTDPVTGKQVGILSDESYRKEEFHRMRVLPYNPLIKKNRWLLFHPEIYNNYSASLQISEEYIKESGTEEHNRLMKNALIENLKSTGWKLIPPDEQPETKESKPVQTEQPAELQTEPEKEKLWPAFISWAEKNLTDRTKTELKNLHLSEQEGYILISGHSTKQTRAVILNYFTNKGFTKIRFEEKEKAA